MTRVVKTNGGVSFKADNDSARIIVSGQDTGRAYSLLAWTIAAADIPVTDAPRDYGPHLHRACEETFLVQSGSLEFLIGDEVVTLNAGDFVRVPPGVRHGYQNISGEPVDMLVTFSPGGFEQLFVKYQSDQAKTPEPGFVAEATRDYASKFGLPNP